MIKIPYTPMPITIGNNTYFLDYGGESGLGLDFDDWVRESHKWLSSLNLTQDQLRKLFKISDNFTNTPEGEEF